MILVLMLACNDSNDSGVISCDREPALTFDNFGKSFLAKHCTGCHSVLQEGDLREGAPLGIDLNTYADVLNWADRIEIRSIDNLDMPPGGGPSEVERGMLEEWLECAIYPDLETLENE